MLPRGPFLMLTCPETSSIRSASLTTRAAYDQLLGKLSLTGKFRPVREVLCWNPLLDQIGNLIRVMFLVERLKHHLYLTSFMCAHLMSFLNPYSSAAHRCLPLYFLGNCTTPSISSRSYHHWSSGWALP